MLKEIIFTINGKQTYIVVEVLSIGIFHFHILTNYFIFFNDM